MIEKTILTELHFLPCIDYFITVCDATKILIDIGESYPKQSYRNRTYIYGPHKVQSLTIPILHGHGSKILMKDAKIDYSQLWVPLHIKTLQSAYGKAPFFKYYFDGIAEIFLTNPIHLIDLNKQLLTKCLSYLKISAEVVLIENPELEGFELVTDMRNLIHPKKEYFNQDNISLLYYQQVFGNEFASNLSILDLVFCKGTEAKKLLCKYFL